MGSIKGGIAFFMGTSRAEHVNSNVSNDKTPYLLMVMVKDNE